MTSVHRAEYMASDAPTSNTCDDPPSSSPSSKDNNETLSSIDSDVGKSSSSSPAVVTTDAKSKSLSKNQMRKRKKILYVAEKKARRKLQDKEMKRMKARAEGRDLEKERKQQEENAKSGIGHKRREEVWLAKMKIAETSFGVSIDCSFEDKMTPKEVNSLAQQIRYCYAINRKSPNPCKFSVSSLTGKTEEHLKKVAGFPDQWATRAFTCSEKSTVEMLPDASKLVYLTSDSENILEHLDDSKIYVIGGIVDRNRVKRAAASKAESLSLETAKLPISQYLKLVSTKVLTCNHVFEILLKYRELGNDWQKAMLAVLPARKDIQILDDKEQENKSTAEADNK